MNLLDKRIFDREVYLTRTISVVLVFLLIIIAGPAHAWNPKGLFEGIIDTITYLAGVAWAVYLFSLGIQRKFLLFSLVFFFGGLALALTNSTTRQFAVDMLGTAWRTILG